MLTVALASDHAGYSIKQHLVDYLQKQGYTVVDLGVETDAVSSDYPDAAAAVANAVLTGDAARGIVVCGSGIGACIAANKFTGIYASIAHDAYSAAQGVEHDQMNVLCLGGRIIGSTTAESLATAFLQASPSPEDRFLRRFRKVQAFEQKHGDSSEK